MPSSRMHCCYIIIGTEFKEKHILEQDELFGCAIISSGLKGKELVLSSLNSKSLSPSPEPQTPFSSLGTLDFLSTCLGIDSLNSKVIKQINPKENQL